MSEAQQINSRTNPYDPLYPSCRETRAELRIYPEFCSAEDITEILRIEPTESHNKGSLHTNAIGRTRRARCTGWFLSSEDHVRSKDLRDHLDWLLTNLSGAEAKLRSLQQEDGMNMTVYCIWWSAAYHNGPTLWPEQMGTLARLNLECGLDVYFFGEQ